MSEVSHSSATDSEHSTDAVFSSTRLSTVRTWRTAVPLTMDADPYDGRVLTLKRKRGLAERSSWVSKTIRSPIWFEDGNIVIQAEDIQYKMYKGLLATYSPFFKDVFGVPQPTADDAEAVEGCAVINLPESAEDVSYMLGFILEPKSSTLLPSLASVVASLKMAHKYLIAALWDDAVARLRYEFPDRLENYQKTRTGTSVDHSYTRIRLLPLESTQHLVEVVREMGLQRILPALYLHIADKFNLDVLTEGGRTTGRLTGTSLETRITLLNGRAKLLGAYIAQLRLAASEPSPRCLDSRRCAVARAELRDIYFARAENANIRYLRFWDSEDISTDWSHSMMCPLCAEAMRATRKRGQQEVWNTLPLLFGLPAWGELKDFSVAIVVD